MNCYLVFLQEYAPQDKNSRTSPGPALNVQKIHITMIMALHVSHVNVDLTQMVGREQLNVTVSKLIRTHDKGDLSCDARYSKKMYIHNGSVRINGDEYVGVSSAYIP